MSKPNGAIVFLKQNAWAIIIIVVGWVVGFALLQAKVETLEAKVAEYPSQDWFELKFETIDERFDVLENSINGDK